MYKLIRLSSMKTLKTMTLTGESGFPLYQYFFENEILDHSKTLFKTKFFNAKCSDTHKKKEYLHFFQYRCERVIEGQNKYTIN